VKIAELFAELGLKGAGEVVSGLQKVKDNAIVAKVAIVAVVVGLERLTSSTREFARTLDKYEVLTGKSSDKLQRMAFEAVQSGVSINELSGTIQNLQKIKTDVLLGKGMPSSFVLLGIDPNEDPVSMLETLRGKIRNLSPEIARSLTSELGISEDVFYMLSKNADKIDEINQKYLLNKQNRQDLIKLNAEWQKFWFLLKSISAQFVLLMADGQSNILTVLSRILSAFLDISKAVSEWLEKHQKLLQIVLLFGGILLAIFSPVKAAILGIILAVDDLIVAFKGGDSIIGNIWKWIENLKIFKVYIEMIYNIVEKIKSAFNYIGSIADKQINLTSFLLPGMKSAGNTTNSKTNNNEINVYTQGGDNPRETGKTIAEAVSDALYQSSALGGWL
jgi:hypothetical protein